MSNGNFTKKYLQSVTNFIENRLINQAENLHIQGFKVWSIKAK